jgi:hypothetical protein
LKAAAAALLAPIAAPLRGASSNRLGGGAGRAPVSQQKQSLAYKSAKYTEFLRQRSNDSYGLTTAGNGSLKER